MFFRKINHDTEKKDLLTLQELPREALEKVIDYGIKLKNKEKSYDISGQTIVTLLLSPNIYIRFAMETVASQIGAKNIVLDCTREKLSLEWEEGAMLFGSNSEHVVDVAKTFERYGDCLTIRHIPQSNDWQKDRQDSIIKSFSKYSKTPIFNLGSCLFNPTQALADIMTMKACLKRFSGWKAVLCWGYHPSPFPTSTPNSFALAASKLGMDLTIACPKDFDLDNGILKLVQKNTKTHGGSFEISRDISQAMLGAHIVYVANWLSVKNYGNLAENKESLSSLTHWNINNQHIEKTDGAYILHPFPIRRNVTIMDEVLDSKNSLIYEQSENWLHAQKALLAILLGQDI